MSNNHALYYSLGKLRGKQNIYFVNANEILKGALRPGVDLLVMPGGASRYKSSKLNGKGNQLITEYVKQGGRYLGICAGAYMACETTYWAKGKPHEIIAHNELSFFPGDALGPIETYGAGDNYNGTAAKVVMLDYQGVKQPSLYVGGCIFQPREIAGYEVLATFSELPGQPAAIVKGKLGKGRWLLTSTHPEYDREALDLIDFKVIGNDYQEFSNVERGTALSLGLLDDLLKKLCQ